MQLQSSLMFSLPISSDRKANLYAAYSANDIKGSGTLYQIGQKFMGGALSSLAGMNLGGMEKAQYFGKVIGLGKKSGKSSYLLGDKFFDKAIFYGVQSLGADFAYMDKKKFTKRGWYNHFFSFSIGSINGLIHADVPKKSNINFWQSYFGYAAFDYGLNLVNQGYDPYNYKDREMKISIFSLKSFLLSR